MITLRHRDGRSINCDIPDAAALAIKPALASGWAFGRMQQVEAFTALGEPAAPRPRTVKAIPEPEEGAKLAVLEYLTAHPLTSKRKFKAETGMAVDLADRCFDWLLAKEQITCTGRSYSVKETP